MYENDDYIFSFCHTHFGGYYLYDMFAGAFVFRIDFGPAEFDAYVSGRIMFL